MAFAHIGINLRLTLWICGLMEALGRIDFITEPVPTAVILGHDLMLNCSAVYIEEVTMTMAPDLMTAEVILTYQWEFEGEPVENSLPRALHFSNHSLFVPKVTQLDLGRYRCIVIPSNDLQMAEYSTEVKVITAYIEEFHIWHTETINAVVDDITRIDCVTGFSAPPPVVHWEFGQQKSVFEDGNQTTAMFGYKAEGGAMQISMKLEFRAKTDQSGLYYCVATNPLTKEIQRSPAVSVIVEGLPRSPYLVRPSPPTLMISADVSYSLPCEVTGWPPPTILWYKDGMVIDDSERVYKLSNGTLYYRVVKKTDGGRYGCVGTNYLGSASTGSIDVTVSYIDVQFIQGPQDTTAIAGNSVTLTCDPPNSVPLAQVSWYKDNAPFTYRQGEFQVEVVPDGDLVFSSVQIMDEGSYFCVAYNQFSVPTSRASKTASLTVQGSPILKEPPVATTLVKGQLLGLRCMVQGSPTPSIAWFKDGELLLPGDRVDFRLAGQELFIVSANVYDEGMYHCSATNIYGMVESSAIWVEIHVPPELMEREVSQIAAEGATVVMKCRFYGDPVPTVTWKKDGILLDVSLAKYKVTNEGLVISHVTPADEGTYQCQGENSVGRKEFQGVLKIEVPPVITDLSSDQAVNLSQPLLLYCEATGVPQPDILWTFNGSSIVPGSTSSSDRSSLVISSVSHDNTGTYSCTATNKLGQVTRSLTVFVQERPKILRIRGDLAINQGQELTLTCDITGIPLPTVSWSLDKALLAGSQDQRIAFPTQNSLRVQYVTGLDAGSYECMARNEAGQDRKAVQVIIKETPMPPYLESIKPVSTTSMNVTWRPASKLSNLPTYYIIQGKEVDSLVFTTYKDDIPAERLWYEVSGLSPFTEYVWRMAAGNDIGLSGYSSVLGAKTHETAPGPPRNLKVLTHNATAILLTWEVPLVTNGQIQKYQILYKMKFIEDDFQQDEINRPEIPLQHYVQTGLNPYTTYTYKVRAGNIETGVVLWGEFTDLLDVTTSGAVPSQAPPRVQLVALSSSALQVTWQPISQDQEHGPLRGYTVSYRRTDTEMPNNLTPINVSPFNSSVTLSGLLPWRQYSVYVKAFNDVGSGPTSREQTVRTMAEAPDSPPVGIQAWATSAESIRVKWEKVPEEKRNSAISGYVLFYRAEGASDPVSQYVGSAETLQLDLRGLEAFTVYHIQLQAFTTQVHHGNSPLSSEYSVRTFQSAPGQVNNFSVTTMPYSLVLSWTPPLETSGEILSYVIFRVTLPTVTMETTTETIERLRLRRSLDLDLSSFGGSDPHILEVAAARSNWTMNDLDPDTRYVVGVAAKTQAGIGEFNNKSISTSPTPTLPTTTTTTTSTTTTTTPEPVTTMELTMVPAEDPDLSLAAKQSADKGLSTAELAGVILGAILGALLVIVLIVLLCICCCRDGSRKQKEFFSPDMITDTDSSGSVNHLELQRANNNRRKQGPVGSSRPTEKPVNAAKAAPAGHSIYPGVDPRVYQRKEQEARREAVLHPGNEVSSIAATASSSHNSERSDNPTDTDTYSRPYRHNGRDRYQRSSEPIFSMSYPNLQSDIRGFENPGFDRENNLNRDSSFRYRTDPAYRSTEDFNQQPNIMSHHRRRMERQVAAAIATQRNRETSIWADTEGLINNEAVVIYNERTAL